MHKTATPSPDGLCPSPDGSRNPAPSKFWNTNLPAQKLKKSLFSPLVSGEMSVQ